jgi:Subtilase family
MRRLPVLLTFVFAASPLFAAEPNLRIRDREHGRGAHVILSVKRPLTPADRAELAAKGIDVQSALTGGRYIARATDAGVLANDTRITEVAPLRNEQKILRSAYRVAARAKTLADINVIFHADVAFADARAAIANAGGALEDVLTLDFGPMNTISARIAPHALQTLAADDRVLAIGGRLPFREVPQNRRAAQASNVDDVHAAPYNLTGQGQVVVVSELSEAQGSHPEFEGRMTTEGGVTEDDLVFHATHVSGTVGAAGLRADAKGMAPKATIRQFNVTGGTFAHLRLLREKLPAIGAVADNVSLGIPLGWCEGCEGQYPAWLDEEEYYGAYDADVTAPFDEIVKETGTLIVFAAGNAGDYPNLEPWGPHYHVDPESGDIDTSKVLCFSTDGTGNDCPVNPCTGTCEKVKGHQLTVPFDTMTVTGSGKNVLAVGAVHTLANPPQVSAFSSRGPAKDGRVKPDVVARGQAVLSTAPNSEYASSSGTSMAAPVVSGIAALIGEQWQKKFGARPKPEYVRALIIAGAQDLGNAGPDYTYGFGLVDAKASVDYILADNGAGSHIRTLNVADRTEHEVKITTTAAQKLRVFATWADPTVILLGDDAIEAKALVNDIDVKVIGPNGTAFPYVLDKARYQDVATRGVNGVDNNEMIEIADAPAGEYRVIVTGTKVTSGPQPVIVISNAAGQGTAPPCTDANEPNNSPAAATAFGNTDLRTGAICTQGDADYFTFSVDRHGAISVALTAQDTPLRMTMTVGVGQPMTVDVPVSNTRTMTVQYSAGMTVPATVMVKIEAIGAIGANPRYDLAIAHGQLVTPKKRSVR